MKTPFLKLAVAVATILLTNTGKAQQNQPFWSNQGNTVSGTDFLGSSNNQPLIFKTNNQEAGRFDINQNLFLSGNITTNKLYVGRIVSTDSIIRFGDSTIYMDNTNNRISWTDASTIKGLAIGNIRPTAYGLNSIAIGTGVSTGTTADNAIIIGSTVSGQQFSNGTANSLMVGFNTTVPTFYVGPGTGVGTIGKVGIGTSSPTANFEVMGTTKFSGSLSLGNSVNFGTNYGMKYIPATSTTPSVLAFGPYVADHDGPADPPTLPFCLPVQSNTINSFNGLIQSWGYSTNNILHTVNIGYNGENGMIELQGDDIDKQATLNINTDCGKDVNICNQNAGYVKIGRFLEVGSVNRSSNVALNVAGTFTKAIAVSHPSYESFLVNSDGSTQINIADPAITANAFQVYDRIAQKSNFLVKSDGSTQINITDPAVTVNAFQIFDNLNNQANFLVKSNGHVYARRIEITMNAFPDYVFENNYKLLSLEDVKTYIAENKRLPGMPSAKQIETEGADLGELARLNVEKTEELYLYVLQLNERMNQLEKENEQLKAQLQK